MTRFFALGTLDLRSNAGETLQSVLTQQKRKALLLYLAVAKPRGPHARSTLLALMWPEMDEARARAALSKGLHHLRTALGPDAVLTLGHEEVALVDAEFWCDVAAFEVALDAGRLEDAVELYKGDLAPGFFLDEAPEFEQWLDLERDRLRKRAVEAFGVLTERAEASKDVATAVNYASRAAALAPLDDTVVRRLIFLLERHGDRAGALTAYTQFADRMSSELDAEPAAETAALAERIRAQRLSPTARLRAAIPVLDNDGPVRRGSRRRWAAALVLILVAVWLVGERLRASSEERRPSIAVVPFDVRIADPSSGLAREIQAILMEAMQDSLRLRVLSQKAVARGTERQSSGGDAEFAHAVAKELRTDYALVGNAREENGQIRLTASLYDQAGTPYPRARGDVSGDRSRIDALVKELAWQLEAARPTSDAPLTTAGLAPLTRSVVALQAFLRGENEYHLGQFASATRAYREAVAADSSFGYAYFRLSLTSNWIGDWETTRWAVREALRREAGLTRLQALHARGWQANLDGDPLLAQRYYQAILANAPNDPLAWLNLGELLFHWGPSFGHPHAEAQHAFERSLTREPSNAAAMMHLARLAAQRGARGALDSLAARVMEQGVDSAQALELRALRATFTSDRAARDAVIQAAARIDDGTAFSVVVTAGFSSAGSDFMVDLTNTLLLPQRQIQEQVRGRLLRASLLILAGHRADAIASLQADHQLPVARSAEYRAAIALVPFDSTPAPVLMRLRDEVRAFQPDARVGPGFSYFAAPDIYPARRLYLLALLSLRLNDVASARRHAAELSNYRGFVESDTRFAQGLAKVVNAELLLRQGKMAEALAALGEPALPADRALPTLLSYPKAHERFLRGRLLQANGRAAEAARWYNTFPDPAIYDLIYLPAVAVTRSF